MLLETHSEIVRLDRLIRRAQTYQAHGEKQGDIFRQMRAERLEAAADAKLNAIVLGDDEPEPQARRY